MFYPQRAGDYVYDVTVTVDDSAAAPRRFRAHLSNIEHLLCGQLATVAAEIQDGYGHSASEAIRMLETHFETWRQQQPISWRP
jgi:hypothetical protein